MLDIDGARESLAAAIRSARARHEFAVWAYVIMPEHVHLLIYPRRAEYSLPQTPRAIKQTSSPGDLSLFESTHACRSLLHLICVGREPASASV